MRESGILRPEVSLGRRFLGSAQSGDAVVVAGLLHVAADGGCEEALDAIQVDPLVSEETADLLLGLFVSCSDPDVGDGGELDGGTGETQGSGCSSKTAMNDPEAAYDACVRLPIVLATEERLMKKSPCWLSESRVLWTFHSP